ncbi:hypothetical protein K438DRAFT_1782585 [Mycena galopus ATCC 62051]|nr:hypothetical protein K438DRAFT_1782585 [Mycena galopus ATCC 62051]
MYTDVSEESERMLCVGQLDYFLIGHGERSLRFNTTADTYRARTQGKHTKYGGETPVYVGSRDECQHLVWNQKSGCHKLSRGLIPFNVVRHFEIARKESHQMRTGPEVRRGCKKAPTGRLSPHEAWTVPGTGRCETRHDTHWQFGKILMSPDDPKKSDRLGHNPSENQFSLVLEEEGWNGLIDGGVQQKER